ncbi:MAG: pyridoxal phosphate-dependent decarboxylase family protein [Anaerolineae bacterium]
MTITQHELEPTQPELQDMDLETFRRYGYQVVDWIAEYLAHIDEYSVLSQVEPGDIKNQLPSQPPDGPEPMARILDDFERVIIPGITHWNHPSFFAYFGITGSMPGILGELLSAALNVNGMLWKTSPAATELEELTLDWLRQMLGLPAGFRGVILDTASMSSLIAIAAAREALDLDIRRKGMAGRPDLPRLRMYTSEQAHSSIEKGAITLGIGQAGVRKVPTDDAFRMDAQALAQAIEEDIAAGWRPFCVAATVGTTSTTSIDPVPQIAEICQKHDLWLHVDGAYGGMAAVVPEMRHVLAGCQHADSIVVNPHKWLFTPIDCSAFYVRDPDILKRTFSLIPEYLTSSEDDVTNYMDWGVQLGRRFRALKLWMVIRFFGHEGIAARIREHIRLGQHVAQQVDVDPDFERLAPTPFSTVCFRAQPRDLAERLEKAGPDETREIETYLDELNEAAIDAVNATGRAFFSHTKLNGRYTIRMAIGNIRSDEAHVARAWELIREHALRIDSVKRET